MPLYCFISGVVFFPLAATDICLADLNENKGFNGYAQRVLISMENFPKAGIGTFFVLLDLYSGLHAKTEE
jgi:hypothetical protein